MVGYTVFFYFIYSNNTLACLARTFGAIYARVYNCKRLIWQLWTCVLSLSEVNFIVGYLTTAC